MNILIVVLALLVKLDVEIEEEYFYVDAVSDIELEIPPLESYPQPRLLTDSIGMSKLR